MYVAPGCQTLASPTVASTPHSFAPRRCSTPTRVPKPRAATGNDSTPPHDPAPFPPSLYYQTTVAETACSHVSCVNDTARNIVRVAESKQSAEPLTTGRPTHPTRSPSAMGGS